jgi:DNA repair exonuclease SbcCD nuclease subunit
VKLLFVGDVHLSDRAPSTRKSSYTEEIFDKLWEIADIAAAPGVEHVVFLGDIFHSKIPRNTSHVTVARLIEVLKSMPDVLVVPGNHDYANANVAELVRSPLRVVEQAGAVTLIGVGGESARGLDLDAEWSIVGIREEEPVEAFRQFTTGVNRRLIVAAHSPIFPTGQNPPYPFFPMEEVAAQCDDSVEIVAYGHIHDEHGRHLVDGTEFFNFGSISRGSLFEENPKRRPAVALVDLSLGSTLGGRRIERIELTSAKPWDEVFRVEEVMGERERNADAASFAAALAAESLSVFSVEGLVESLRAESEVPQPVKQKAISLVEAQQSG